MLNRRAFLCGAISTALAKPLAVAAQQAWKVYRIGFLTPALDTFNLFSRIPGRLELLGWRRHVNARFEHRFAVDSNVRLSDLVGELAGLGVDVIVPSGTTAALAAKSGGHLEVRLSLSLTAIP